jgi:Raf kinase inhibitor-like YbhB/YbcL family protein
VGFVRPVVTGFAAAALITGCGGDNKPKRSDLPTSPPDTLRLASPEIKDGGTIPKALTCDGKGTPPTITYQGLQPADGAEAVFLVVDPDAPGGEFTHWTVYGIPTQTGSGLAPHGQFVSGVRQGKNSAGKTGWTPPCPPKGSDAHHYTFAMYVIKNGSTLPNGASPEAVKALLKGATARGSFTATYKRG